MELIGYNTDQGRESLDYEKTGALAPVLIGM
jgi:hypothetical protein